MPYHPGAKKETWLPLSHFLELQVVAASLKSMLGLEEVKAWSRCFLFLNSEFEELMRDPMDILWIRFFCRQVSTYPYWVPSCGMPLIKVATGESASWKWDIFRSDCTLSTRPEQPCVLLMHLMNSCDLVFLGISLTIHCLVTYSCRCTANQQLPCHLCPRNSCVLMLLREAGELPVTGRLPDGRSIVEKVQM